MLNKSNRDVFLYSVIAGMLSGFLLDILAQQARELRNINRRREEEPTTEMEEVKRGDV